MSALNSLRLAIEVAARARDQADQAWVQAQRAVTQAQAQLDQLASYASDTDARWATAAAVTVSAELMSHHQHFMIRLRQAIGMQGGVIMDLERQAEGARQRRVQQEVRLKALQQLLEKKHAAWVQRQARLEQKQMDELAVLGYARRAGMAG
ncbi:MAG: flagellar export protein FliJ [Curvibacter sp.]|jgi:flagellar FliJ protein|nr:flagellar export protein FliJ [Curvibacter sp.]